MENLTLLISALPVFGIAMLVEVLAYRFYLKTPYGWRESLSSFLVVLISRPISTGAGFLIQSWFTVVYDFRFFTLTFNRWWHWAVLFFVIEFVYYWFHRFSHTVRWMWASHCVHHSPNQLTLSVAYRLGFTAALTGVWLFFIPLILLGCPPTHVGLMIGINLLYQFWLHTELVPELGPLELFFNTPSQHRVHHATNERYLDKNFGGVVCIYDRIFGTYQREEEECRYGVLPPVRSLNPFSIALHGWIELFHDVKLAVRWKDRFALVIRPPGWKPGGNKS